MWEEGRGVEWEERSSRRRDIDMKWIIFRKSIYVLIFVLIFFFVLIVPVIKGLIYFKYLCVGNGVGRGGE